MELKITKNDAVHQLKNMFLVIFGTAVLAFGTAVFIEPYNLVTGGVSGLAIVLADFIPLELDFNFIILRSHGYFFFWDLYFWEKISR